MVDVARGFKRSFQAAPTSDRLCRCHQMDLRSYTQLLPSFESLIEICKHQKVSEWLLKTMRLIKPLASDPPLVLTTFENVTLIVQLVFPPQDLHPLNPLFLPQTTPSRVALAYQKLRRNSATCIWRRPQRRSDETKRRLEAKVFEERVALIKWREELQRWDLCLVVVTIMMMYVWEQRKGCKGLTIYMIMISED